MPRQPPEEHSVLEECFIQAFDSGDTDFPIVARKVDPRDPGYAVPVDLSACTDARYTGHRFTGVTPIADDRRVLWIYLILPGPYTPFTRYDLLLGPIQGRKRLVVNTSQSAALTATSKINYESYNGSDIVSWELEEINSNGTGSAGNPTYPILVTDFYDINKGAGHQVAQIVADITSTGTLVASGGTVTETRYEPFNQFLRKRIIETWAVPAPTLNSQEVDDDGATIAVGHTIDLASSITEGETVIGGVWMLTESQPYSGQTTGPLRVKVTRTRALATNTSPIISESRWDDERRVQLVDFWQYVPGGTSLPTIGSTYATASVLVHDHITSLTIADPGNGYSTIPTLIIPASPGGGTQATAIVASLAVVGATVAANGIGYALGNVQTVTGGTGTAATLTITGASLTGLAMVDNGVNYVAGEIITLGGGISIVPATARVSTIELFSATINAAGTGMVAGSTTLTLVQGTFTAAATLTVSNTKAVSATVAAGGASGTPGTQTVTGTTGTGTKFQASVTVNGGGAISAVISITVAGDYTVNPTAITAEPVTGAGLIGAQLSVIMGVKAFGIANAGNYTVGSTIFTTTGGGNDCTLNAAIFEIRDFTIASGGNYQTTATSFTQIATTGNGIGATFDTPVWGSFALTVTTGGAYTVIPGNPAATTSSGAGTGMTLVLDFGIGAVTLTNAGTKYYVEYPTVTVSYGNAQIVAEPDALQLLTTGTGYVREHGLLNTPHALIKRMTWRASATPPTRVEFISISMQWPAIFTLINTRWLEVPSPGYDYKLIAHRSGSYTGRVTFTYAEGPMSLPTRFQMISPAAASRLMPIPPNCAHGQLNMGRTDENGVLIYVELFPASSSYSPGATVIAEAPTQKVWSGNGWERRVIQSREGPSIL